MAANQPTIYPLLFESALHERVWGGHQLELRLGKAGSNGLSPKPIGESWEIYWKNRVANGPYKGQTLGELIAAYPEAMLGSRNADPEFPLLIKFIDAQDWLSVQVHPDDELARELEGEPRGKTECWYIIDAAPDARIAYSFAQQIDADGFRQAIETGRAGEVMQYVNVAPGDFIYVPARTMHAIGPGILLYELQQTSDTTYRVYDWDRLGLDGKPRPLHIEKSLRSVRYDMKPPAKTHYQMELIVANCVSAAQIINTPYFSLEKRRYQGGTCAPDVVAAGKGAHAITVILGSVTLKGGSFAPLKLDAGQSVFVPASIGDYTLVPEGEAEILRAFLPGK